MAVQDLRAAAEAGASGRQTPTAKAVSEGLVAAEARE